MVAICLKFKFLRKARRKATVETKKTISEALQSQYSTTNQFCEARRLEIKSLVSS